MGCKYTVQEYMDRGHGLGYGYLVFWQGRYLLPALWNLWRAKRLKRAGCVTLEIRG